MSVKQPRKKKSKQKVLPVNCNRMMTAGACPLTFWTVIIYKLKGYKVRGVGPRLGRGPYQGPYSPSTGVVRVSELSPITLQPKKKKSPSMEGSVYSYASAEPSDASFTGPVALLLSMWYMHSMLRGHVSVCVYVCVCVRVFFSTACVSRFWLSAEPRPPPHDWLIAPCDVTACSVLEWESRCAPLLVSVLSACADVSSFCGWSSLLVFVSLGRVHFGF